MAETAQLTFEDGAAYEDFMGVWSRIAGEAFLPWLAPEPGWRWADVGCGNGAFTQLLVERCAPAEVHGIDPSDAQLAYARTRMPGAPIQWQQGDAMALPWPDRSFDAAVMALVIFFVPDPARGVAEMARVVRPGGSVSAYAWDLLGGGFPFAAMSEEMAVLGVPPLWPPSAEAANIDALQASWAAAGLEQVETREITLQRSFADYETFWRIAQTGPRVGPRLASMSPGDVALLKTRLHERLAPGAGRRWQRHVQRAGECGEGARCQSVSGSRFTKTSARTKPSTVGSA